MTADWLLLALAFPAVLIDVGHGQNGFLTAALIGGALVMLDRRPIVAGILFGLLVYKPQYGLLLPLVLAVSGRWKCFGAAAATVALLTIATTLTFGASVWHAFLISTHFTRTVVLEQGNTGWYKIQSVFAWARMWGAPIPLAYALQGAATVAVAAALACAVAQHGALSAQGRRALSRHHPRHAVQLRLRHDGAGAGHRLARRRWPRIWLRARGKRRRWPRCGWCRWSPAAPPSSVLIPLGVPAMLAMFVLILRRGEVIRAPLRLAKRMAFSGASATILKGAGGDSRGGP